MLKYFTIFLAMLLISFNSFGADLTKTAKYDFSELMRRMIEEPNIREQFPNALKEPFFIQLMLEIQKNQQRKPSNRESFDSKIQKNTTLFILDTLSTRKQKIAENYQKSGNMKQKIILALALANKFRGFSIILKPDENILYSNTDISKQMANVVANYKDLQKSHTEEVVDEQQGDEQ